MTAIGSRYRLPLSKFYLGFDLALAVITDIRDSRKNPWSLDWG